MSAAAGVLKPPPIPLCTGPHARDEVSAVLASADEAGLRLRDGTELYARIVGRGPRSIRVLPWGCVRALEINIADVEAAAVVTCRFEVVRAIAERQRREIQFPDAEAGR